MSENKLITIPDAENRKAALRRARRERRERALGARSENRDIAPVLDEAGQVDAVAATLRAPSRVEAPAYKLPPKAEFATQRSHFGGFLRVTFMLFVVTPTIISAFFFEFVASNQYATQSAFAVRGASSGATGTIDVGGLLGVGGVSDPVTSDSYIVSEYVESKEMVEALIAEANFLELYSRQNIDPYYRLDPEAPIEDIVGYWQMMSDILYDPDTAITHLTVRAFRPSDAETVTSKVIEKAEELVNQLSVRSREDSVATAQRELDIAEKRFEESRKAVAAYRGDGREIDPAATATTRQSIVGELESELARRESELRSLRATMSENAPRVQYVKNQIDGLRRQIATEKLAVAVNRDDTDRPVLTQRLSEFEELLAEREFAQRSYVSSLATVEAARVEALKQQRYLTVFIRGTAPELSTYPEGWRWTGILFGGLLAGWAVFALIASAIRDRVA